MRLTELTVDSHLYPRIVMVNLDNPFSSMHFECGSAKEIVLSNFEPSIR